MEKAQQLLARLKKAEADASQSLALLREAGFDAEMVTAPCCGMAGAFGFEREHYEASKKAFQRALGPAIEAHPNAQIIFFENRFQERLHGA